MGQHTGREGRLIALAAPLLLAACARSTPPVDVTPPAAEGPPFVELTNSDAVDQAVQSVQSENGYVGIAVGIAVDDKIVFLNGYGFEDREDEIPVDPRSTMFRWASLSKGLTGVIGVLAQADGDIDLDAPARDSFTAYPEPDRYLPQDCTSVSCSLEIPPDQRTVTTRQLLAHIGGAPHYGNGTTYPVPSADDVNDPDVNTGMEWALDLWTDEPLIAIPGTRYSYSTFGHNLAGVTLEHATGESFASLVDERVATPLGMHTLQPDYDWVDIEHRATGYVGDASSSVEQPIAPDVSWKLAGGGFISTVEDLTRYCVGLNEGLIVPTDSRDAELWRVPDPDLGDYALGFGVNQTVNGLKISHTGAQEKTRTAIAMWPEEGLCIAVMTNSEWAGPMGILNRVEGAWRG